MWQQSSPRQVKEFSAGAIVSQVFKSTTELGGQPMVRYTAQIQKRFREDDGTPQNTNVYCLEDFPDLINVALETYMYLCNKLDTHARGFLKI